MQSHDFPRSLSFTITNACQLRCQMCGQWSAQGYVKDGRVPLRPAMALEDWKRLTDEAAEQGLGGILLRGGEPFLWPHLVELVEHIATRGLFTSIDTNGTQLAEYADDLVRIGRVHVTVSVDGPPAIHDAVRGVDGCFDRIARGIAALQQAERRHGTTISKSITFTISPWSYRGLGEMPEVARRLGIGTLCIAPYYYLSGSLGRQYEQELEREFRCQAVSWRGFHHESSDVDSGVLLEQLHHYRRSLGDLVDFPYLPLSDAEYVAWFRDPVTPVHSQQCPNIERLVDIQPSGAANFCVDFPDYSFGNAREATLRELWNSEEAARFRERRRRAPLSACHRCGAKYMALVGGDP